MCAISFSATQKRFNDCMQFVPNRRCWFNYMCYDCNIFLGLHVTCSALAGDCCSLASWLVNEIFLFEMFIFRIETV